MGSAWGAQPPPTDATVSLVRLTNGERGRLWYDVAHFRRAFPPEAPDVTMHYRIVDGGAAGLAPVIEVTNTRWLINTPLPISGLARIDTTPEHRRDPSKLVLAYEPNTYFPLVPGPEAHWILLVSPLDAEHADYRYAVVSNPERTALQILSATPQLAEADTLEIVAQLTSARFGFAAGLFAEPNLVVVAHSRVAQ
jgi:lipocalin